MPKINPNDINQKCGRVCFSVEEFEARIKEEQARAIVMFDKVCQDNNLHLPKGVYFETVNRILEGYERGYWTDKEKIQIKSICNG